MVLKNLCLRYAAVPYARTKSDAEARGLELLVDGGVALPQVNVRVAGEEADYVWGNRKEIIEIDGPQFHQFRDEDERKARVWNRAGYSVRRLPSDAVYSDPAALLRLAG